MSETVIKAELVLSFVEANISKQYQLGQVGTNTLRGDMQRPGLSLSKPGGIICAANLIQHFK